MPRKPKSGPPYTNIPPEVYVVVTNPWCMDRNPRQRVQDDFDRIASWAQFVLQQSGRGGRDMPAVECIYGMGTRDEIILQFAESTNITPLLGEHRWGNFRKDDGDPNDPRSTCVFLYNWRNNGDPANHSWTDNYPCSLPLDEVPAKWPYPAPSWASPPTSVFNLVHPIPRPPVPPPIPDDWHNPGQEERSATSPTPFMVMSSPTPPQQRDQREPAERAVDPELAPASRFRPYEPPPQYPSRARFLNQPQTRGGDVSSSKAPPSSPKFIKKLDPYELEEDAFNILRSATPEQEDTKEVKLEYLKPALCISVKTETPGVKTEEDDAQHTSGPGSSSGYRPSQALIDAFGTLQQPEPLAPSARPSARSPRELKGALQTVPSTKSKYKPSTELEAEINALLRGKAASSPSGSDARRAFGTRVISAVAVKREHEDDAIPSSAQKKKIKIEEN